MSLQTTTLMTTLRALYLLVITVLSTTTVYGQRDCGDLSGSWVNQDSSLLNIDIDSVHFIGGYSSIASGDTSWHALRGVINDARSPKTIAFMVEWGAYGSITSWTGYCRETEVGPEIVTMWHLVRPYVEEDWARFVTNQSIFVPYSAP